MAVRTGIMELEFLLEFEGSKRPFGVTNTGETCQKVERELQALGVIGRVVLASEATSAEAPESDFLLQRWCTKWEAFVDVKALQDLSDGDRLSVVRKPQVLSRRLEQVCAVCVRGQMVWYGMDSPHSAVVV